MLSCKTRTTLKHLYISGNMAINIVLGTIRISPSTYILQDTRKMLSQIPKLQCICSMLEIGRNPTGSQDNNRTPMNIARVAAKRLYDAWCVHRTRIPPPFINLHTRVYIKVECISALYECIRSSALNRAYSIFNIYQKYKCSNLFDKCWKSIHNKCFNVVHAISYTWVYRLWCQMSSWSQFTIASS